MGQRTVIIVQHDDKKENKRQTRAFYHQWGIGRILPSQLVSVLNGTLSTSEWRPDYLQKLQPQGTMDITENYETEELNALDFDNPQAVGEAIKAADNNNGGLFVRITTSGQIGHAFDSIEYAYMCGGDTGDKYKGFCSTEEWFKKNGYEYIDDDFKAYYNQVVAYFEAKDRGAK